MRIKKRVIQPYFGFINDAVLFTTDADWLSWHWEHQCQENNNKETKAKMEKTCSFKTKAVCILSRFLWNAKLCLMWLKKKKKKDTHCKRNETSEHSILQSRLLPLPYKSRQQHFYNLTEYFQQNCSWELVQYISHCQQWDKAWESWWQKQTTT